MIRELKNIICRIAGHSWRYKDYSNWMNENGGSYDFKASRNCIRCNEHGYLYKEWEIKNVEIKRLKLNYKIGDINLADRQPDLSHYSDGVKVVSWQKQKL